MPPMPLPPSPVRLLLALLLCLHPALRGTNIPDPGGAGEEDGCEERRALLGEGEAACGGCEPCGGDCAAPGSDSARLGSVNYRIGVARSGHTGLAPLRLCVSGELPSPSLASPQGLRVLRPTGGRLSPPAESADGSLEATVTMQDGSRVSFRLPPGSPVGLPQGRHSATDWRLEARAADGSAAPSREGTSWYALRLAGRPGHFRLPAGGGPSLGFVGPTGREDAEYAPEKMRRQYPT